MLILNTHVLKIKLGKVLLERADLTGMNSLKCFMMFGVVTTLTTFHVRLSQILAIVFFFSSPSFCSIRGNSAREFVWFGWNAPSVLHHAHHERPRAGGSVCGLLHDLCARLYVFLLHRSRTFNSVLPGFDPKSCVFQRALSYRTALSATSS